jgi:hypothetical protein
VLSSELKTLRAFTLNKAWFKNADERVSISKDELIRRKDNLALRRLYGDPEKKIQQLLTQSIQETIGNLAAAIGMGITIEWVILPEQQMADLPNLDLQMKYQCGDITPIFEDGSPLEPELINGIEVYQLPED